MIIKNYFIINPAAGKKNRITEVKNQISSYFSQNGGEFDIYITEKPGSATDHVKSICENDKINRLNFFSCGGDGTFNEVASGAVGYKNAFVVPYPIGSGNDFIKSFENVKLEDYLNITAVLNGSDRAVDVMKIGDKLCFNIACIGVDAVAAKFMPAIKRIPLLGGIIAYYLGLAAAFVVAMKNEARFICDDEELDYGKKTFTLASIANGRWYGGGFKAAPIAEIDDGLLDFVCVPSISRLKFLRLVGIYKRGEHLEKIHFLKFKRCKKIKILSPKPVCLNLDGEVFVVKDPQIELVSKALNVIIPNP